jgi:hypothetical protein
MLTRVSFGLGLRILAKFSRAELNKVKPPPRVVEEYKRLQRLEMQSSIANIPIHQSEMQQVKRLKSKHCANNEKHEEILISRPLKRLKTALIISNNLTHIQFLKWVNNSCWIDSLLFALLTCFLNINDILSIHQFCSNAAQKQILNVFRRWSTESNFNPSIADSQSHQLFFWEYTAVTFGVFNSVWDFFRKIFRFEDNQKDLGDVLFGITYRKKQTCLSCSFGDTVHKFLHTIEYNRTTPNMQAAVDAKFKTSRQTRCFACQDPQAHCFVEYSIDQYPPFLYIEITSLQTLSETITVLNQEYELLATILDSFRHIRSHPRLQPLQ